MDAPVCIANIGPRQRRVRRNLGLAALGLAVVVGLLVWSVRPYRLVLLPLVFGGVVGVLQARGST